LSGIDPVRVSLFAGIIDGICEEMGTALQFAALAANIKDRRDFSAAVFDADGKLAGMGAHLPVHLGAMPSAVEAALEINPGEGDIVVLNDPYRGGTHLPDITMVAPVHEAGGGIGFVACRAHHADVGGPAHGSMPLADSIYAEGLRIPPVLIAANGRTVADILALILANVRDPDEREADIKAQIAACLIGVERLQAFCKRWGSADLQAGFAEQLDFAERLAAEFITTLRPGRYKAEAFMEDDGYGSGPVPIKGELTVAPEKLTVDLASSAVQTTGGINAPRSVTLAALLYAVTVAAGGNIRPNAGLLRRLELVTRPGTIVDASPPAACAGGNVETSQRLVELFFDLLGGAGADVPAASQGTMNNISMGWGSLNYYETVAGGCGAGPQDPGADATHSHMTNSLNTPIEALETTYPLRIERYAIRPNSGGPGKHKGGDGVIREYRFLEPTTVHLFSERRILPPRGRDRGKDGLSGRNILIRENQTEEQLPSKGSFPVGRGDLFRIETPGGAGWGSGA
jgi:N-methylhydantoinase B